jgi:hypothetical protein
VLQYANGTISFFCINHDPEQAINNVKLLLYMFEMMLGIKRNHMKSEIVTIGGNNSIWLYILICHVVKLVSLILSI